MRGAHFENYAIPKAVWSLALPTIIGMIVLVLYNLVDTYFIGQTGDPNQVAAVSLAMPIFFILMAIGNLFGIGASANISRYLGAKNFSRAAHISSFAFYGAKNTKRLKGAIYYTLKALIVIGIFFFTLFYFGAERIIQSFINDSDIISYGMRMLRAQIVAAPLLGIIFVVMTLMQVTGRGIIALILSVCRQGLAFIPAIIFLNAHFGLDGLIWSQAVADAFSIIISTITFVWFLRSLPKTKTSIPH